MDVSMPRRMALALLPTPLQRAPRMGAVLGIDDLFVKRDDLTGFSLGGNKVRKLEFLLGEALAEDADTILVLGGPKSNLCQAAAAAASVAGLNCELILYGDRPVSQPANLTLAEMSGARPFFTGDDDRSSVDTLAKHRADLLTSDGHRVYVIPRGGATAVGAVGYHLALAEVVSQLGEAGVGRASIVVCVGSGGTLGGVVSGMAALGAGWPLFGASVSRAPEEAESQVLRISAQCARLMGTATPAPELTMIDARGPGYGQTWSVAEEASEMARETEGLILDPVFTAKTLAALVQLTNSGLGGPVVFWHTGGTATAIDSIASKERP